MQFKQKRGFLSPSPSTQKLIQQMKQMELDRQRAEEEDIKMGAINRQQLRDLVARQTADRLKQQYSPARIYTRRYSTDEYTYVLGREAPTFGVKTRLHKPYKQYVGGTSKPTRA